MTRSNLNRTLRRSYVVLGLVLIVSLATRLAEHIPGIAGTPLEKLGKDVYDYLKDMALVFVTVVAAYLANVFQKRQQFITALKEEWRDIIEAKSALFTYTQLETPTLPQYLAAFCEISETLDNMRTVYRNIGETADLVGIYPYAPLHDMRRALQTLDPRKNANPSAEDRKLARDAILQSFYALRESFLEELDLEAPDSPLMIFGARRLKRSGAPDWARGLQAAQGEAYDRQAPPDPRIHPFLERLYEKEHETAKPWRQAIRRNGAFLPAGDAAADDDAIAASRADERPLT
jgi:hypothetical protein